MSQKSTETERSSTTDKDIWTSTVIHLTVEHIDPDKIFALHSELVTTLTNLRKEGYGIVKFDSQTETRIRYPNR